MLILTLQFDCLGCFFKKIYIFYCLSAINFKKTCNAKSPNIKKQLKLNLLNKLVSFFHKLKRKSSNKGSKKNVQASEPKKIIRCRSEPVLQNKKTLRRQNSAPNLAAKKDVFIQTVENLVAKEEKDSGAFMKLKNKERFSLFKSCISTK